MRGATKAKLWGVPRSEGNELSELERFVRANKLINVHSSSTKNNMAAIAAVKPTIPNVKVIFMLPNKVLTITPDMVPRAPQNGSLKFFGIKGTREKPSEPTKSDIGNVYISDAAEKNKYDSSCQEDRPFGSVIVRAEGINIDAITAPIIKEKNCFK